MKKKILIVEDNKDSLEILGRYASLKGKVELYEAALNSTASTLKDELDSLTEMVRQKAVS
jgi:hypothetical protein